MSRKISRVFKSAAAPHLHPCVWNETPNGGYWECNRRAMPEQEAIAYVIAELPWATGNRDLCKFLTQTEAWRPTYWTLNPLGDYVWK